MGWSAPGTREKRAYIREYKLEKGCQECGYNEFHAALELDHVDREHKNFKMSDAHNYSWDRLNKELLNCIVLCSICHRKKTQEERDYYQANYTPPKDLQYDLFGEDD